MSKTHNLPADLKKALQADKKANAQWKTLTPLAQNEWICWVTIVKKAETRAEHIARTCAQLKEGKRRPCCWMGCPHRTDKPMNASQTWILSKTKNRR